MFIRTKIALLAVAAVMLAGVLLFSVGCDYNEAQAAIDKQNEFIDQTELAADRAEGWLDIARVGGMSFEAAVNQIREQLPGNLQVVFDTFIANAGDLDAALTEFIAAMRGDIIAARAETARAQEQLDADRAAGRNAVWGGILNGLSMAEVLVGGGTLTAISALVTTIVNMIRGKKKIARAEDRAHEEGRTEGHVELASAIAEARNADPKLNAAFKDDTSVGIATLKNRVNTTPGLSEAIRVANASRLSVTPTAA